MKKYFYDSDQIFFNTVYTAVGVDEHGGADGAAGVPAHEGVDGEPGRGRGGHHPPHLLLHPRHGRTQGERCVQMIARKMFNPFSTFLICVNVSCNAANQQQSDREDVDKIGLVQRPDSPKYSKVKIDIEAIYNKFNFKIPSNQFFSKFSSYSPPPPPPGGIYLN